MSIVGLGILWRCRRGRVTYHFGGERFTSLDAGELGPFFDLGQKHSAKNRTADTQGGWPGLPACLGHHDTPSPFAAYGRFWRVRVGQPTPEQQEAPARLGFAGQRGLACDEFGAHIWRDDA